jgi:hypothetical protein
MKALFVKVGWMLLVLLDISVNRLFNGRVETISSRAGRSRNAGKAWGMARCGALDEVNPGHCDRAIKQPLGPLG